MRRAREARAPASSPATSTIAASKLACRSSRALRLDHRVGQRFARFVATGIAVVHEHLFQRIERGSEGLVAVAAAQMREHRGDDAVPRLWRNAFLESAIGDDLDLALEKAREHQQ